MKKLILILLLFAGITYSQVNPFPVNTFWKDSSGVLIPKYVKPFKIGELYGNTAGNIGVGTTTLTAKFKIQGDGVFPILTTAPGSQFLISGATDPNQTLAIGINNSASPMYSYFQSTQAGYNAMDLILNPRGGRIGLGTAGPTGILDVYSQSKSKLVVDSDSSIVKVDSLLTAKYIIANRNIKSNTDTAYTVLSTDYTLICDATSDTIRVNLPQASSHKGRVLNIKKIDSSGYPVIIEGYSSETIDDAERVSITIRYQTYTIQSDGTEWWIL